MAKAMTEEEDGILIQYTCKCKKKVCSATLTSSKLCLEIGEKQTAKVCISITDILSVKTNMSSDDQQHGTLCILYAKQEKNLELKKCSLVLENVNSSELKQIGDKIEELIGKLEQRPRKLLVLINPKSGRSRGVQVYEQTVASIFKESNVETDVIITGRPHHTEEIVSEYGLLSISGIVIVGGDGLYHELCNGLMQKRMKELDRNVDDPNADLPDIEMPIGIIPCGTGNGIASSCFGSNDVVTAALAIVLGYKSKNNIIPVHSNGKLLAYSTLLTGYGLWGDIIHAAESKRSQGILRYPIAIANQVFIKTHRQMSLTVHWKEHPDKSENLNGKVVTTDAIGLIGMVAGGFSKDYLYSTKPPSHTFMTTYLNKPTGRMKFLSFMIDLMRFDYEKIKGRSDVFAMEGSEFTVKLDEPSDPETEFGRLEHMMNIDGEIFNLQVPEFQIRFCAEKVTLYCNLPYSTGREVERK